MLVRRLDPQRYLDRSVRALRGERLPCAHRHCLVACFPKSGSTYLTAILAGLDGIKSVPLVPGYERREQELSPDRLALFHDEDYVSQIHLRCSAPTIKLCRMFSIHPVVLVRNLFDVAVSMLDHWDLEGTGMPMAYVDDRIAGADSLTRQHFFADMVAPWYINFFVSWSRCPEPVTWVRYEELIRNERATVSRICADSGLDADPSEIAAAVDRARHARTRFNRGVTGRGAALAEDVKDKLRHLAAYYPSVDFSPIGL